MKNMEQNETKLLLDLQEAQMKLRSKLTLGVNNMPVALSKSI